MIDLHTHSTYSDGMLTIENLVLEAINNDVNVLSITDHDTIMGLTDYKNNFLKEGIIVVPGVEFSTVTYYLGKKTKIHLLGYGYEIGSEKINCVLDNLIKRRYKDNYEYIDNLIKKFPYLSREFFIEFNYSKSGWLYKNILSYIKKYLSLEEFLSLENYLINNKPVYNKYNESIEDIIKLLKECNAYSVFAHPQKCNVSNEELQSLIKYLVSLGLDGIESYHIEANENDRNLFHKLALEYSLYETGGSDFHSYENGNYIGNKKINFPKDYDFALVKKLVKENKVLGIKYE